MILPTGGVSTIFLIALIGLVDSATNALDATLENNCGTLKFRCRNGECIGSELLCDGRADCSDQSDETREECLKPEIICPEYAFRCTYGACIDGDGVCNNIDDCLDRSDELLPRCGNKNSTSGGSCLPEGFLCKSGQCVPGTSICDGWAECDDRSDETGALCGSNDCPTFNFRCAYGACIEDRLKCNGVRNCADGSDEDPELCRGIRRPPPGPTEPTYTPAPPPTYAPPQAAACPVPAPLQNGRWQLHKDKCPSGEHCSVGNQVRLGPGTQIVYSCNPGYALKGTSNVFCTDLGNWSRQPVCAEVRCKPLTTASTDAACTYQGEWTSCEGTVLPGTVAKVTCRNGYSPATRGLSTELDRVTCKTRGHWEPEPIRCIPVCGVTAPSNTKPLSVNSQLATVSDFPWHATLYRDASPTQRREFICGATIIQNDLLITAAHCVWDEGTKTAENPSRFAIATGNVFRDFDSVFHNPNYVKKRNVTNIYLICNYLGLEGNHASDIAILRVDRPFRFSALLMPICLDTQVQSDLSILEVGNYGRVAGFGRTSEGPSSAVLQYLNVPYVPLNQCKASSVSSETEKFITIDKFCAGYTNGTSVCDGDSGGGLVFKTGGLWYLRGIVSVGIGSTAVGGVRTCDPYMYSLYTKVSSHIGWIQDVIIQLEWYNSFPTCSNATRFASLRPNLRD